MIVVRGSRRVAAQVLIVILAGATAFGLGHLVVGGLVNGNPRAAGSLLVLRRAIR